MQTYVVNLDSATTRWEAMEKQLSALGLPYTRIRAVDGRKLSPEEFRRLSNRFRFFLLNARRLQPCELGCALSHQRVYDRMAQDGIARALILEDDAVIDGERLAEAIKRFEGVDPELPQIYLLAARHADHIPKEGLHRIKGPASCAMAYLITASAAKRIREVNTPVFTLSDAWPIWQAYGIEASWLTPFAVSESGVDSQITWQTPSRARWKWYRALWHIRHRLGGKLERLLFPRPKF